jgi:hypothetical protein
MYGHDSELKPSLFGTQAQRRRWLKQRLLGVPGFPVLVFLYMYIVRLGFLDGRAGLLYATFRAIQYVHIKAKIAELSASAEVKGASGPNADVQAGQVETAFVHRGNGD